MKRLARTVPIDEVEAYLDWFVSDGYCVFCQRVRKPQVIKNLRRVGSDIRFDIVCPKCGTNTIAAPLQDIVDDMGDV